MAGISPQFSGSSKKPDFKELAELVRATDDPAEINKAMLAASNNPPFWPDDKQLVGFIIAAKSDPALDAKILKAAALSAPAREAALIENRVSDKQGAFAHFIYADGEDPSQSRIYKVIRAPQIGGGTGAWGGLKEGEDVNVGVTVNREVYEEVIDAVKLLLKTQGQGALEKSFDENIKAAFDARKPLSDGVASFIAQLSGNPALQSTVQGFADQANDLISDLVAAEKHKLFTNRDDAHAIERGWGFKVDAFAHVASISRETADKFDAFHNSVEALKKQAVAAGLSAVAGEMQGVSTYTVKDSPANAATCHYGHEGLAELAGFALLIREKSPAFDAEALWQQAKDAGTTATLAKKMRLTEEALHETYTKLTSGTKDPDSYLGFADDDYRGAFKLKRAAAAAVSVKPPKPQS